MAQTRRWLSPFSSCCCIWLAESALRSPPASGRHSRDRRAGETCELNVTRRLTAPQCGRSRPYARAIWLKWHRYDPFVTATVLAGCSDQGHDFLTTAYDQVRSLPFLADILRADRGCVLYIGLQIFTLWQKSKIGVRIIFDGVLYSKFYGILKLYLNSYI